MKSKTIKLYFQFQILIFLLLSPNPRAEADQESCLLAEIDKACAALSKAQRSDYIEIDEQHKIPACLSRAVEQRIENQSENEIKEKTLLILDTLSSSKEISMSPEFQKIFYTNWKDYYLFIDGDSKDKELYWPPTDDNPEKKEVSRSELIEWMGKERYLDLRAQMQKLPSHRDNLKKLKPDFEVEFLSASTPAANSILRYAQSTLKAELPQFFSNSSSQSEIQSFTSRLTLAKPNVYAPESAKRTCFPLGFASTQFESQRVSWSDEDQLFSEIETLRAVAHEQAHHVDACRALQDVVKKVDQTFDIVIDEEASKARTENRTLSEGAPYEKYPLASVITCLQSEDGGSFSEPKFNPSIFKQSLGPCFYNFQNEAFGDWAAAKVVGRRLTERTNKVRTESTSRLEPTSLQPRSSMRFTDQNLQSNTIAFPKKLADSFIYIDRICTERISDQSFNYTHPSWEKRFLKIYAREPAIADHLGCGRSAQPPCGSASAPSANQSEATPLAPNTKTQKNSRRQ